MEETGNIIHLRGQICQNLQFGHELFGEQFYVTTLRVPRLSGAEDFLPITISERLLIDEPLTAGSMLCMEGQLRSYNKVIEGAGRLLITAFAQRILNCEEDEENPNRVQLTGALCKPPSYRTTPFGRENRGPDAGCEPFLWQKRLHSCLLYTSPPTAAFSARSLRNVCA